MPNGPTKKKIKKSEESKRKEEGEMERAQRELEEKRARIAANVEKAKASRDLEEKNMKEECSSTSYKESEEMKKKKGEYNNGDNKRADDKRRDSLGGSVSTSSNSSGTDCDEVLSEAARSAITSPPNGISSDSSFVTSPLSRITIADTLSSIHQVAQSVVDAGTAEALNIASEFLPYTMTSQRSNKAGARNLAAAHSKKSVEKTEGTTVPSGASPTPRKVSTPILAGEGGRTAPSPAEGGIASFRSIADDCPTEIPGATVNEEKEKKQKEKEVIEEMKTDTDARSVELLRPQEPLRSGSRYTMLNDPKMTYPFFNDIMNSKFVNAMGDPLIPDHVFGYDPRRSDFGHHNYDLTSRDTIDDNPRAYLYDKGLGEPEECDMNKEYEQRVKTERTDTNGWVAGERAVLKNFYDDIPKLVSKQKTPWIRDLLQLIFDGKAKKVWNRMRIIANVLRKQREFALLPFGALITHIATTLLDAGTNKEIGYSYVHILSAQGMNKKECAEEKHGRCATLRLLLSPLSAESLQRALSLKCTAWASRKPIHFATSTGYPCQLDVLLSYHANGTEMDALNMTPLVHAVIRDQLLMVRQLAWCGVDTMAVNENNGQSASEWKNGAKKNPVTRSSVDFITKRNDAFEKAIVQWISEVTQQLKCTKAISDVHTVSCYPSSDQQMESIPINNSLVNIPHWIGHVNKTIHLKLRNNVNIDMEERKHMFLVLIPFTYFNEDVIMPASSPSILRHTLFQDDNDRAKPVHFFKSHPFLSVKDPMSNKPAIQKQINPLLVNPNLGSLWAYKIPSDVFHNEVLSVNLSMDLSLVKLDLRPHLRLLAQIVLLYQQ